MADTREVIQRVFDDSINNRDVDAADELFAEDFADHGPMRPSRAGSAQGPLPAVALGVRDAHSTVENVIVQGELAGWLVRTTGTHTGDGLGFPATGRPFETVAVNMGRFPDGIAVEHWSEQGFMSMLVQLGMMPMPAG